MLLDARKNALPQNCDAGFLLSTLHLMNQIMHFCPKQTFELMIASEDELVLPRSARDAGILFHRMGADDPRSDFPMGIFVRGSLCRIKAPDQLANRHQRFLYPDGNILSEGCDLKRLQAIEREGRSATALASGLVHKSLDGRAQDPRAARPALLE